MGSSVAQTIDQLRTELGDVLHVDWTQRRILCERGDLVRDLALQTVKRDGREVRVPPELWSSYQLDADLPEEERPPITTWTKAAEVLEVSTNTIHRRRRRTNHTDEPSFANASALRRWWRQLLTPKPKTGGKKKERKPTTLQGLIDSKKARA